MGRWSTRSHKQEFRDWMMERPSSPGTRRRETSEPAGGESGSPDSTISCSAAGESTTRREAGVVVLDACRQRVRGRARAPLRRHTGVPGPLETPLFVHRAALVRAQAERSRQRRTLALVVGAGVTATWAMRVALGG